MVEKKPKELAREIIQGSEQALARGLTLVENRGQGYEVLLEEVYPEKRQCPIYGLTGAPGVGKSTITNSLVTEHVENGEKVGVIAVDPSSPFSGGAILGDRVRMMDLAGKKNVFIRSMASRGALGGLSPGIVDAVSLFQAFGMDLIIIETVGVGQSETDIVGLADTVVVVLMPGSGDDVQTIKAGLLEIGDIFLINKADIEGASVLAGILESMLSTRDQTDSWDPPVLKMIATEGKGFSELENALFEHKKSCEKLAEEKEKMRSQMALKLHLQAYFQEMFLHPLFSREIWDEAVASICRREKSPAYWVRKIMKEGEGNEN